MCFTIATGTSLQLELGSTMERCLLDIDLPLEAWPADTGLSGAMTAGAHDKAPASHHSDITEY